MMGTEMPCAARAVAHAGDRLAVEAELRDGARGAGVDLPAQQRENRDRVTGNPGGARDKHDTLTSKSPMRRIPSISSGVEA